MKVTFCTFDNPDFTGGPNSWLRRLLPALRLAGVEIRVLFFTIADSPESCPCYQDLHCQGIKCQAFSYLTPTEQKIHWLLSRLAEEPPDIFVPNLIVSAFYASRWIKEAGIPTIGVLHSDDEYYRAILREFVFAEPRYQLSALVCVSKFLEHNVNSSTSTTTLIRRISYGVPLPQQSAKPPSEPLKLIYVGRLEEEQKRISEVTYALCRAVREVPGTEAVIFGDGSARTNVERILSKQGRDLPVRLAGLVNNARIQEIMLEYHVLVLLSDYEGLPISLMEAMGCGLVPICLQMRSGIPELVEDRVNALLVSDRGDDFVNAVKRLKNEPGLWNQLSLAARVKIETSYSNEVCAARWLDLLRELDRKAKLKKNIRNPGWMSLPPVNPGLAREDWRQGRFAGKVKQKMLDLAGIVKRRVLGVNEQ